jgi:hypothetical protein
MHKLEIKPKTDQQQKSSLIVEPDEISTDSDLENISDDAAAEVLLKEGVMNLEEEMDAGIDRGIDSDDDNDTGNGDYGNDFVKPKQARDL